MGGRRELSTTDCQRTFIYFGVKSFFFFFSRDRYVKKLSAIKFSLQVRLLCFSDSSVHNLQEKNLKS